MKNLACITVSPQETKGAKATSDGIGHPVRHRNTNGKSRQFKGKLDPQETDPDAEKTEKQPENADKHSQNDETFHVVLS